MKVLYSATAIMYLCLSHSILLSHYKDYFFRCHNTTMLLRKESSLRLIQKTVARHALYITLRIARINLRTKLRSIRNEKLWNINIVNLQSIKVRDEKENDKIMARDLLWNFFIINFPYEHSRWQIIEAIYLKRGKRMRDVIQLIIIHIYWCKTRAISG